MMKLEELGSIESKMLSIDPEAGERTRKPRVRKAKRRKTDYI